MGRHRHRTLPSSQTALLDSSGLQPSHLPPCLLSLGLSLCSRSSLQPELSSASERETRPRAGEAEAQPCRHFRPRVPSPPPTSTSDVPGVLMLRPQALSWFQTGQPSVKALPSSTKPVSPHGPGLAFIRLCVPSAGSLANTPSKFVGE